MPSKYLTEKQGKALTENLGRVVRNMFVCLLATEQLKFQAQVTMVQPFLTFFCVVYTATDFK